MMLDGKAENSLFTEKSFSRGGSRGGAKQRKNQAAQPEIGQASLSRLPTPDDGNANTARKANAASSTNASNKNSKKKKKKSVSLNRDNMNLKQLKGPPTVEAPVFAIFEEIKSGRLTITANKSKVTPTELDIFFNKSKRDAGNTLTYTDFVQCLSHCARQLFAVEKEKSKAKPTPSLAVSQPAVIEPQPEVVDNPAAVPQPIASTSTSTAASNTKKKSSSSTAVGKVSKNKRVKFSRDRLTHPVIESLSEGLIIGRNGFGFTVNVPDYLLVLVVKIIISFLNEPFMEPISRWMETETRYSYIHY